MSDQDIYITLLKSLYIIILPQDCYGWYRHCGYVWVDCIVFIAAICSVVPLYRCPVYYCTDVLRFVLYFLIELLEKIIIKRSPFSDNKNLQNLLLMASRADKGKVVGYINKLQNNKVTDIAQITIERSLYEEALTSTRNTTNMRTLSMFLLSTFKLSLSIVDWNMLRNSMNLQFVADLLKRNLTVFKLSWFPVFHFFYGPSLCVAYITPHIYIYIVFTPGECYYNH